MQHLHQRAPEISPKVRDSFRSDSFQLDLPVPKFLTLQEELVLAEAAAQRGALSPAVRYQHAFLLFLMDRFAEAIEIFRGLVAESNDFNPVYMLGMALLSTETPDGTREARDVLQQAVDRAVTSTDRSRALADLGKACTRLHDLAAARVHLHAALQEDLTHGDAYKRVAMLDFRDGQYEGALAHAERMVEAGVAHSRVLAMRALAHAGLGNLDAARDALGLQAFLEDRVPAPPAGWESLSAFNRDLAAELSVHPGIRYERYGAASTRTWRIDQPAMTRSRIFPALQGLLVREIADYVAKLPSGSDPWLRALPERAVLRTWCVITDGDGFEEWHVHQNGWLSGAYYVEIPDSIVQGTDNAGCVEFALPPELVGEACSRTVGAATFRPHAGLLTIFPSHTYHRTYAHHGRQRRICVAFDCVPVGAVSNVATDQLLSIS